MHIDIKIEKTKKTTLGECPIWDYRENLLYFVDIEGQSIRQYNPYTFEEKVIPTPQKVGCIALCKDNRILAAMEDGIYYLKEGEFTLAHNKIEVEGIRFNDGKVGPDGRYYAGTRSLEGLGALYRLDPEGKITKLLGGVYTSNGLDWSLDSKILYYIDTRTKEISAFDFDIQAGNISNIQTIFTFENERPDGMCIDSKGMLYVAHWEFAKLTIIDPIKKALIKTIKMPAAQTTCPTFGGKDLSTLYLTSARMGKDGIESEVLAGSLFSIEMDVKGRRTNLFG